LISDFCNDFTKKITTQLIQIAMIQSEIDNRKTITEKDFRFATGVIFGHNILSFNPKKSHNK